VIALLLSLALALQGIPVQAQQAGRVSGVLKDTQGKPIPGIRMAAIARPQSLDEAVTSAAMSSLAETDEQGRFTLEGIPPGRYYIAAGRLDAQTYYPGTVDMATAKEVAITPGSAVSGIDFTLGDSSFGRANTGLGISLSANPILALPLRVSTEGGEKMPVSAGGKFVSVKLDMAGSIITTPITSTVVNVPGPQTTAYRVTVENLPETHVVKSILYGTTDLSTNTLRLTPANFPSPSSSLVFALSTFSATPAVSPAPAQALATTPQPLPQTQQDLLSYLNALAASRGLIATPPTTPTTPSTPPSLLSITLAPVTPKLTTGARVSGQMSVRGNRTVYVSGIPGAVYSDGTFEVYGIPPGRHSIVTRDNPTGLKPLAASVVVENGNLDGIVLVETAMLPLRAWEPSPPRPAGGRPAGNVPLARLTGSLLEELSKQPITEGTVLIKTNGYTATSFPVSADGRFELPPLLPGTYDLEVQVFGHSSIKQSIEIDDQDMKIELLSRRLY
jgi:hypothetical protein